MPRWAFFLNPRAIPNMVTQTNTVTVSSSVKEKDMEATDLNTTFRKFMMVM